MVKLWYTKDQEGLKRITKWQIVTRSTMNRFVKSSPIEEPNIIYRASSALPSKFYQNFTRYIVDDTNAIVLGP
jgi:hypothetical protein